MMGIGRLPQADGPEYGTQAPQHHDGAQAGGGARRRQATAGGVEGAKSAGGGGRVRCRVGNNKP